LGGSKIYELYRIILSDNYRVSLHGTTPPRLWCGRPIGSQNRIQGARRTRHPITVKFTQEQATNNSLSLTSSLDGVGGQRHAPAALSPGKSRYPLYKRLGGPNAGLDGCEKSRPPPGFDPRTVQPVAVKQRIPDIITTPEYL